MKYMTLNQALGTDGKAGASGFIYSSKQLVWIEAMRQLRYKCFHIIYRGEKEKA